MGDDGEENRDWRAGCHRLGPVESRGKGWKEQKARTARSLSGVPMNTISSSGDFIGMAGICLDRLLKQRFAL